jgi:hypothetical protein
MKFCINTIQELLIPEGLKREVQVLGSPPFLCRAYATTLGGEYRRPKLQVIG